MGYGKLCNFYDLLDKDGTDRYQKEKGCGKHDRENDDCLLRENRYGWIPRGMRVDLTARFDHATGWSYLFIVTADLTVSVNSAVLVM